MDHNDKKVKRKVQMFKVIQLSELSFKKESSAKKARKEFETKVNSVSNSDNNHFSLLHRGLRSDTSDPYSYRSKIPRRIVGRLKKTLDTGMSLPRCSSTYHLDFSLGKKSPVKETSNKSEMKVNSISDFDHEINRKKFVRLAGASASVLLLTLLALTVLPISHKPEVVEAAGTSSSTTITTSAATASVDLTTISSDGTFASSSSSEQASFGVTTTNYTGYTLTITAADDAGTLTNTTSTGSFSSISGVVDEKTFDDSSYNGKWGYKPSKMNSTENVGFWPSPTTTATTLDVTKSANASFNNYTIALGARAAYTQPTGTYTKTVNLHVTSNPANYSITYNDNTGITPTNLPDPTSSTTSGATITLSSVTPSKTGFVFGGWCATAPTVDPTTKTATCSTTPYAAGSTYDIDQTTANTINLYATWSIPSYDIIIKPTNGIASVSLNGQSCTNNAGCTVNNLTYGQPYTLTATTDDGYTFSAWSPEGAGTVADITSSNTTFTVGQGTATITAVPAGAAAKTITVNFAAAGSGGTVGVSNVVFTETSTGNTAGTVSTSGGTVKLNPGVGYTMTTNFAADYDSMAYALNSTSYGALDFVDNSHARFIPNSDSGNAVITVTSCIKNIAGTMQTYNTPISQLCDNATGTLTDSRDNKSYAVGVVTANNGGASRRLWMTQNLAIGCNSAGTGRSTVSLTNSNSNVSSTWSTSSAKALTSGNSYTEPRMQCDSTHGAWYNYAAATAGTVVGETVSASATYDICPAGWRLPDLNQVSAAASNKAASTPITGGYYSSGDLLNNSYGCWWGSSVNNATDMWTLTYNSGRYYTDQDPRFYGFYVRCVRN